MKLIVLTIILFISIRTFATDCPTDSVDLIINTQQKYDNIKANFPNCDQYTIIMYNGKFIGDPNPTKFGIILIGLIGIILLILKILISQLSWFKSS